ncbi:MULTISPECIES: glycoside hydrolase family 6 protein [Streptomyces]|uniref:glycoside hydrolase family 6 protein n=1 Tax=Streptomyces TaxID=1883 RepID=UPI001290EBBC|nr:MULTISPECIES: glycoside hydrolase family 6 protein [Streptomyces]MCX5039010.1 glycoside hydrolase family 6 protein [Streptomyces coelicoflavus]QFX86490.1 endoglucanase [Streptomyces sp. SYP-A7193]
MVAAASVVVAVGTVTGMLTASGDQNGDGAGTARPQVTHSVRPDTPPASPSPSPSVVPSRSASSSPVTGRPAPAASPKRASEEAKPPPTAATRLYRHSGSQVLDWVRAHPDDPRRDVIASRIADQPAAVWFADHTPATITARVRAVTAAGAAQGRVPVLVPYAIPDRDCGGHSEGGAPDLDAYDAWIDRFAAGLGPGEVIVVLEPDSVAQSECLSAGDRADRFASLARAGRVLKDAGSRTRVYYDAGHSGWHAPAKQAGWLEQAGAASADSSDGVFSNVSNFHATADEIAYDRAVLDALGGPATLGAVIDTSRNGNGAPPDGEWCDPAGRRVGRAPTLSTGMGRIDAYLWVKLPGESDGCKGEPGTFTPSYAYDLAR